MSNSWFQFKQFIIHQDKCAMKVTTDGCLFGAFVSEEIQCLNPVAEKILDLGCGTGLLSLMVAQKNQKAFIDTIEIDTEAFEQASENITKSPWADSINIINADANLYKFQNKYDIIFSNPPFYENELKGNNRKKNIAHHNDGLLLPDLLKIVKRNLNPTGSFYFLLPYKRYEEIKKLLANNYFEIRQLIFVRQTVGHEYFRIILSAKCITSSQTATTFNEIVIKDESGNYTQQFNRLLEPYYLNL